MPMTLEEPKRKVTASISISTIGNGYLVLLKCGPSQNNPLGNDIIPPLYAATVEDIPEAVEALLNPKGE